MQTCTRNGEPWNCGQVAKDRLAKLIAGKQVVCVPVTVDRYRRTVRALHRGRGRAEPGDGRRRLRGSIPTLFARLRLRGGQREGIKARPLVRNLRTAGRGAAGGGRPRPESGAERTRARHERPVARGRRLEPQPTGRCGIKGDQSRRGELIYHLPGRPYYDRTVAEAIFCSEDQARAAGYRRSRADRQR